jgi:hypothetical protein
MSAFPVIEDIPGLSIQALLACSGQADVYIGTYEGQQVAVKIFRGISGDAMAEYTVELNHLLYHFPKRHLVDLQSYETDSILGHEQEATPPKRCAPGDVLEESTILGYKIYGRWRPQHVPEEEWSTDS